MFTDAASAELCTINREKHRTGLGRHVYSRCISQVVLSVVAERNAV